MFATLTRYGKFTPKAGMLLSALLLAGCAAAPSDQYQLEKSYLKQAPGKRGEAAVDSPASVPDEEDNNTLNSQAGYTDLPPLSMKAMPKQQSRDLASQFSDDAMVEMATDEMLLPDFLHYVFGEVLKVNYLLGEDAKAASKTVTLNIQNSISQERLFVLTRDLLRSRGFSIKHDGDVYFIDSEESNGSSDLVFGYGYSQADVPDSQGEILQIVPLKYGMKGNLTLILPRITTVQVTPEKNIGGLMLRGQRASILKAMEFIQLVDSPSYKEQIIGAYESTYVPINELRQKIKELLAKEGFTGGLDDVILDSQNLLILFSSDEQIIERARFWLEKLDVPGDTDEKQYFVYQPEYARASDIAESLGPLLGSAARSTSNAPDTESQRSSGNSQRGQSTGRNTSIVKSGGNEDVSFVVDQRSNSLVVNATGQDYKSLLPLIKRLDVLPKQVMLEVVIAEVTLKNDFQRGVEFFLNNNNYTLGNKGSFGVQDIGGLSYVLTASERWDVQASLKQEKSLVNILSRPSLVVRDGMTANMQVGTDIPIVNTTSSPDVGTTSSVQYRKTGLTLNVTPTVNSKGVVIMVISQETSSVVDGGITAAGAPSIFDRSMQTEVVASSGQTVILGGLISENNTTSDSKVPGLGDLPLLGELFSSKSDVKDKTELIVMVTPRIIESEEQWQALKASMKNQFQQVNY